jgi:hypothetical protein
MSCSDRPLNYDHTMTRRSDIGAPKLPPHALNSEFAAEAPRTASAFPARRPGAPNEEQNADGFGTEPWRSGDVEGRSAPDGV